MGNNVGVPVLVGVVSEGLAFAAWGAREGETRGEMSRGACHDTSVFCREFQNSQAYELFQESIT